MSSVQRNLNALIIIILSGVLMGGFAVQIIEKEMPCPLCMLQRLGMIGLAASLMLNVQFGVKMTHYGLALLSCLFGGFVALRQISLHVCPGFPEFGLPVLGLSLYTWSFLVFVLSVLAIALLLFLYDDEAKREPHPLNAWAQLALFLIIFVSAANILSTLFQCGLGPCQD